jgi:single-strand DNA-binding protein
MDLNKAMIIGRLTKDPEVRNTPSGQNVATFSLATNYVWTDQSGQKQEKVEFHNIVAWRKLADVIGRYLKKGAKVYIEGRLQTRDWVGQDSIKRYRTEIIVENMIMLDRAGATQGGYGNEHVPMPSGPEENFISIDENNDVQEDEIRVENIPF